MTDYTKLQQKLDELVSLAKQVEATGEGGVPGNVSGKATAWVNEAAKQLEEIAWNLETVLDTRMSSTPSKIVKMLNQIATAIESSKRPERNLVVEDIRRIIKSIGE